MSERYLQFRNTRTGQTHGRIDVTGHSERSVERVMRGMLINIGDEWVVDDSAWLEEAASEATS
jgi:hypothetical protein